MHHPGQASLAIGKKWVRLQLLVTSQPQQTSNKRTIFVRVLFSKGLVFISKPRCGSTSIRRHLGPFLSKDDGDFAVDVAKTVEHFHPHDTAPYVKAKLAELYPDHPKLTYFMTIRNPVDMLWSYYRFFRPDADCLYNYQSDWNENSTIDFEEWIQFGKVGMNPAWQELAPKWISIQNLSPLSLEAHAIDRAGVNHVKNVFQLENTEKLNRWLTSKLENRRFPALSEAWRSRRLKPLSSAKNKQKALPHVNQSDGVGKAASDQRPVVLSDQSLKAIRTMFPEESKIYKI